jgi:hypothetical protein
MSVSKESKTTLPPWVTGKVGAQFVTEHFFELGPRGLERWPVEVKYVNGAKRYFLAEVIAHAKWLLANAPKGGLLPAKTKVARDSALSPKKMR